LNTFVWVTPSLRIDPEWPDCICDPAMAARWIDSGDNHIAYVPNVAVARGVLERMGLSEAEVDDRIHFALTGEVLGS
jgi:hypothetical protein